MPLDEMEIEAPFLRKLFEYWSAQRHGRLIPFRSDIDPHALMLALPHLFMVDVERGDGDKAMDFSFRVAGTFLEAAFDVSMTKKHLRDLKLDDHAEEIQDKYRRAVLEKRPIVSKERFLNQDERLFDYERLLLPLATDEPDVVKLLLGAICFKSPLPTPSRQFLSRFLQPDAPPDAAGDNADSGSRTSSV